MLLDADLHEKLNGLSRQGAWDQMREIIDDDVLAAFAVAGTPAEVVQQLHSRYRDVADRVSVNTPYPVDPAAVLAVAQHLRALSQESETA